MPFDSETQVELLVLFQQYLGKDPKYLEVAAKLKEALETNQLLPVRYDINGNAHPKTLAAFLENVQMYSTSLPDMFQRLYHFQSKFAPPPIRGLPIRFFTSRKTALDRKTNEKFVAPPLIQSVICTRPSPVAIQSMHPIKFLLSRELGRNMPLMPKHMFRKEFMQTLNRHARIMGHQQAIFFITFDRSGRYVFTGSDDNLIKCWDVHRYLLRFTFRGHDGEISDLSVSHENSLLASGSRDKTVRIWSLRKGSNIRVFKGHSATINSVAFIPLFFEGSNMRYFVSTGNDGAVVFHRYNESTMEFIQHPFKFNERGFPGGRIISSSHSPGGNIVIVGDTHQAIVVYLLNEDVVDRLYEFTAHSGPVDVLVWAHHSLRFASGSKDGTAKVWSISNGQWTGRELIVPHSETVMGTNGMNAVDGRRKRRINSTQNAYKVTMVTWSLDDDLVISLGSDYLLRTWEWKTGIMLGKFRGHQNLTFSLMAHPLHRELVVSAGHDGLVIVWNIYTGKQLCCNRNVNYDREAVAIFNITIAPDGSTVCIADSLGCMGIYGVNQIGMNRPHEQFFSTDYRMIHIDPDGRVTDDGTGLLPEQLSPPFFVNSIGDHHPEKEQRLVPGNDINVKKYVIKPCAWLKRDIIEAFRPSIVEKYKCEQVEHCRLEQIEIERDLMLVVVQANIVQQIVIPVEQMNKRQRRQTNGDEQEQSSSQDP